MRSRSEIIAQGVNCDRERIETLFKVRLRYQGTDSALTVNFDQFETMRSQFEEIYQQRYGFSMTNKGLVVEAVSVEAIAHADPITEPLISENRTIPLRSIATVQIYTKGAWHETPIYRRQDLKPGDRISGSALILEPTGTNVIEPGWCAELTPQNYLILSKIEEVKERSTTTIDTTPDPVLLEIFNTRKVSRSRTLSVTDNKSLSRSQSRSKSSRFASSDCRK